MTSAHHPTIPLVPAAVVPAIIRVVRHVGVEDPGEGVVCGGMMSGSEPPGRGA